MWEYLVFGMALLLLATPLLLAAVLLLEASPHLKLLQYY